MTKVMTQNNITKQKASLFFRLKIMAVLAIATNQFAMPIWKDISSLGPGCENPTPQRE